MTNGHGGFALGAAASRPAARARPAARPRAMNWLFIHQNFPGQFVHAARHLAQNGDQVVFITQARERELPGVRKIVYAPRRQPRAHPFLREYEAAIENALAVAGVCEALK